MQNSRRFHGGFFNLEMLEIFTTAFKIIIKYFPWKMKRKNEKNKKKEKSSSKRCQAPKNSEWLTLITLNKDW